MRYYTGEGALLLRGIAYAAGSGLPSGGRAYTAVLLAPVSSTCPAVSGIDLAAARHGLDRGTACGIGTCADVRRSIVAQYDRTVAFALADGNDLLLVVWTAVRVEPSEAPGLLEAIRGACPIPTAGLILASDGADGEVSLQPLREAAAAAVREALARRETPAERPAFLIYSRFGGGHWVAWSAAGCPYYPCHHRDGQRCDFCYCPLYPCGDRSLGEEVASSTVGSIWNCSDCTLLHEPAVADHLRRNPMASLAELKRVAARL